MADKHQPGSVANALLVELQDGEARWLSNLATDMGRTKRQISDAAAQLRQRGLLLLDRPGYYKLNRAGIEAAQSGVRITSGPNGPSGARRTVRNTFRERAWRAMRVRRQFTLSDIIGDAESDDKNPHNNLMRYVRYLSWCGYLTELPVRQKGTKPGSNGFKRYRLVKNTDPRAPVYSEARQMLRDPNTKEELVCKPQK